MKKLSKILLTGSSGTIGTRLFEKLLEQGYDVVGFDRKLNQWNQRLNKFTIKGDLLKENDIKKLSSDFDLIIHFAANARVYDLVVNPDLALENIIATYNILKFAKQNKIKNFIFSSSREVYSNKEQMVSKEEDVDIELCESPYSASKISDEALVYSFSKCYGINYIVFRFSNVYGMYDDSDRFVPLMIREMSENKNVNIFGKGKLLDFTYIDDCVDGIIKSIEKFSKIRNNTINIASGEGEKLINVAEFIKRGLNSKSKIIMKPSRAGEVIQYVADISKVQKLLNYKPNCSIRKGIKLSIDWYKKNV